MTDVIMPQMGESIAEGTITKWLKQVGDTVERDEPLFEISTDKVDAEIPAPASGVLTEVRFPPGTTVAINTVVAVLAAAGGAPAAPAPAATAAPEVAPPPTAPAPKAPTSASAPPPPSAPPLPRAEASAEELRRTRSSPVVRRIAAEQGVALHEVQGTGASGRVTRQDILGHLEGRAAAARPPAAEAAAPAPAARPAGERVEVVPMSPIRRRTAEHMLLSRRTSAHVSTVFEVDMTRVDLLRRQHQAAYLERGVKLTYLPFVLEAVVDALKAFPVLNASVEGESIVYRRDVHLGLAVALDWGLIVPVIRHADEKSLLGLARATADLAERARSKKLRVDEVQGGTFTVTNPGVFGSLFGTPIINQPQVAILALGTVEKRPVVRDDAIAIRSMCYLCLTFDHRIVDGADADRFMAHVKATLQGFDEAAL